MLFINSVRSLKGERGQDREVFAPVGVTVTTDDNRKLGKLTAAMFGITLNKTICQFPQFYSQTAQQLYVTFIIYFLNISWPMLVNYMMSPNSPPKGDLNAEGDRFMVAKGGHGGNPSSAFQPSKGQAKNVRLDLKLIADLGLVG